ncbi:MAG: hypothetical protein AAF725_00035 [Acidobacteriota bacterium]
MRENARLAALAAGASAGIALGWPGTDALKSTFLMLPWVVLLGCAAVRTLEPARAGILYPRLAMAFCALVAFAPWRHRLGWPSVDRLWTAALLLILLAALIRVAPALRRRLARPGPPGPAFFLLPLAFYLAIQPWSLDHRPVGGDEPYYLLLSHSLAFDGDMDLANNYAEEDWRRFMDRPIEAQPGDPVGDGGEIFSRHSALLPAVLTPAYRIGGRAGAAFMLALCSAGVAWWTLAVARRLWPECGTGGLLAWALLAFTPPMMIYSHQVWIEVPAALLSVVALDRLIVLHQARRRELPLEGRDLLILAASLALLPLLKMRLLLVAAPLALAAAGVLSRRGAMIFAGGLGTAVLGLLAYNLWRYDNPFKMYSSAEIDVLLESPPSHWLRGSIGMFYDSSFGLFATAPLWWLLIPAFLELARRSGRLALGTIALMVPYLAALAPRLEWYGGWSPPFRYPLVFLPLLALATVPLLERRLAGTRILALALAAPTVLLGALWLTVPGWTYNLADGASHVLHQLGLLWQADVARFFPSTVRPRAATWWWVALSAAVAPLALADGDFLRRQGRALACGLLFATAAALPLAATRLPTRVVEAEDAWARKEGGLLHPERWRPQRPYEIGAWRMTTQARLEAPVVRGGEAAVIRLHVKRDTAGPRKFEISAGEAPIGTLELEELADWSWYEFRIASWPQGAPLVISAPQPDPRPEIGMLLDRVEISWLD